MKKPSASSVPAKPSRRNGATTRKAGKVPRDELRPEYDLSKLRGGVRGKCLERAKAGTNLILLDPDVARHFPDAKTVNDALRAIAKIAHRHRISK